MRLTLVVSLFLVILISLSPAYSTTAKDGMATGNQSVLSPSLPQDTWIINQYGQLLSASGDTIQWYEPPAEGCNSSPYQPGGANGQCATDQDQYIGNNCANPVAGSCSALDSFAASVDLNGGWGAVFGGNVPSLHLPHDYLTNLGLYMEQQHPNWRPGVVGYYGSNGQFIEGGFPFGTEQNSCITGITNTGEGCEGLTYAEIGQSKAYQVGGYLLISSTQLLDVIYQGFPVTVNMGEPNIHGGSPAGCFQGCLSPYSWTVFIKNLGVIESYNRLNYINATNQILFFGQPYYEQGTTGSLGGIGAAFPTPQDALTTAFLNGFPSANGGYTNETLDEAWNPANPNSPANPSNSGYAANVAATNCSAGLDCQNQITRAALTELLIQSYYDPNNPDSFITWFGGRPVSPTTASYACGTGCGWAEFPLASGSNLDPGCSDTLCVNGVGPTSTSNSATHYLVSDQYVMVLDILGVGPSPFLDTVPKAELASLGIVNQPTALAYFDRQLTAATNVFKGQLPNSEAIETLADMVAEGATHWGPDSSFNQANMGGSVIGPNTITDLMTVFTLPWGDTSYLTPGGYFPIGSFQLWNNGINTMNYPTPLLGTGTDWIRSMLSEYILGKITLSKILQQNQGAYTLLGRMLQQVFARCANPCTESNFGSILSQEESRITDPPLSNKTQSTGAPGLQGTPQTTSIEPMNITHTQSRTNVTTVTKTMNVTISGSATSTNSTSPTQGAIFTSPSTSEMPQTGGYIAVAVVLSIVIYESISFSFFSNRKKRLSALPLRDMSVYARKPPRDVINRLEGEVDKALDNLSGRVSPRRKGTLDEFQ